MCALRGQLHTRLRQCLAQEDSVARIDAVEQTGDCSDATLERPFPPRQWTVIVTVMAIVSQLAPSPAQVLCDVTSSQPRSLPSASLSVCLFASSSARHPSFWSDSKLETFVILGRDSSALPLSLPQQRHCFEFDKRFMCAIKWLRRQSLGGRTESFCNHSGSEATVLRCGRCQIETPSEPIARAAVRVSVRALMLSQWRRTSHCPSLHITGRRCWLIKSRQLRRRLPISRVLICHSACSS